LDPAAGEIKTFLFRTVLISISTPLLGEETMQFLISKEEMISEPIGFKMGGEQ